jgi:hypothetical protein
LSIGLELLSEGIKEGDIDPWDRDSSEHLIDHDHRDREEDFFANMFGCPDFLEMRDHAREGKK